MFFSSGNLGVFSAFFFRSPHYSTISGTYVRSRIRLRHCDVTRDYYPPFVDR